MKWIAFAVGKKLDTNKKKNKPKIEIFVHLKTLDKKRLITKIFLLKKILMEIINQMLNNKLAKLGEGIKNMFLIKNLLIFRAIKNFPSIFQN